MPCGVACRRRCAGHRSLLLLLLLSARPQVDSLKDQKRKLLAKGKASDKLMDEKLVRNESKLTSSQAEYLADRDQCCGRMLWTFREASGRLETVILRLMQFEDQLGKEVAASTVRFPAVSPPLLAHIKAKAINNAQVSTLEQCVIYSREMREGAHTVPFETIASAEAITPGTLIGTIPGIKPPAVAASPSTRNLGAAGGAEVARARRGGDGRRLDAGDGADERARRDGLGAGDGLKRHRVRALAHFARVDDALLERGHLRVVDGLCLDVREQRRRHGGEAHRGRGHLLAQLVLKLHQPQDDRLQPARRLAERPQHAPAALVAVGEVLGLAARQLGLVAHQLLVHQLVRRLALGQQLALLVLERVDLRAGGEEEEEEERTVACAAAPTSNTARHPLGRQGTRRTLAL